MEAPIRDEQSLAAKDVISLFHVNASEPLGQESIGSCRRSMQF